MLAVTRCANPFRERGANEVRRRHPRRRKQELQAPKDKQEAKSPRNDKNNGQQDQAWYKCGIWGH
ncbi:hypothetical protein E2562_013050 [Oryza meyeriana var. granulata]|uniref:Uncharacterized protein n=1 Tax=Oryza meyeriana var. granulata TaxID=110450 RepID=A0A6G1DIX9_9ORYZ|nr:hypothetical protein E2562_013050 [Oryza meyeriana var. granulata]